LFDEHQTPPPKLNIVAPVIVVACGGAGILLSFGLCGAAGAISGRASSAVGGSLGMIGIVVMGLSIIALFVGCFCLVIAALIHAFRR
jgi:FtsH-binding integral membrane protein